MSVNNGLYNILFGEFEHAEQLLEILDLNREMFGRYRDCLLNEDGTRIVVLTRCGGNNRQDYDKVFELMEKHDCYLGNSDDPSDETYCYFEFKVPVLYLPQTRPLATGKAIMTVGQRFDEEKKKLENEDPDAIKRAQGIVSSVESQIKNTPNGGIIIMGDQDWKFTRKEN